MRILLLLLALSTSAAAQDGGRIAWQGKTDDPKGPLAEAARKQLPIMLFFTSVG